MQEWQCECASFRRESRRSRQGPLQYRYTDHLAGSFPAFATWLNVRVRTLRREQFPLADELIELHCPPSNLVMSYRRMWAFGCHYRCLDCGTNPYVSVDHGIAAITEDASTLDVGILKDILLVTYGKLSCVVMRGTWMKSTDQWRASVKKDRMGFWSVLYEARAADSRHNPFVFPSQVSQVYFMDDELNPAWKVVLHHEPRARRVTQDKEFPDIETAGEQFPPPEGTVQHDEGSSSTWNNDEPAAVIVPGVNVPSSAVQGTVEEEDQFLDDADYEEEMELQYME